MIKQRIAALIVLLSVLIGIIPCYAETPSPELYIDDVHIPLENPCVVEGDKVYIPFEEIFFKLGVYMNWDEELGCYIGMGNNGEIRIEMDKMTAMVDYVDLELPYPTKKINGVPMIPLYLVEDAVKTDPAVYNAETNSIHIKFPDINDKYEPIPTGFVDYEKLDKTLPAGDELWFDEYYNSFIRENGKDYLKVDVVEVEDMHFDKAVRIETLPYRNNQIPTNDYDIQPYVNIKSDYLAGEVGIVTFWARATKTTDETSTAHMRFVWEQSDNYQKAVNTSFDLGPEWKKYYAPMYNWQYNMRAGNSRVTIPVGWKPQVIEIADIHMRNFHYDVDPDLVAPRVDYNPEYHGIEEDALWRKEAYKRIEKYRKNDMEVYVTDENGNPVENATVDFNMTDHEFNWGVSLISQEIMGSTPDSRVGSLRINTLNDEFNMALDGLNMKESPSDYYDSVHMYKYFYENGLRMRGHSLTWDTQKMQKMPDYETATYEEKCDYLLNEVAKEVWLFKGMCIQWDALNEPNGTNGFRSLYGTEVFSRAFQLAKALDPTCKLYLNDFGYGGQTYYDAQTVADKNIPLAKNMIDNERAPIDGMGVQGHVGSYNYPQFHYYDLDRLASIVDEVTVTEYDIKTVNPENEGKNLRDRVIATYSHPKAMGFVIWQYASTYHWISNGPFYDLEWNEKDGLHQWRRLMEEFFTKETVTTDKDGKAVVRGHRGDYDITVTVNDGDKEISGMTKFRLTNSDNTERDNRINVKLEGGNLTFSHANIPEVYAKHNVKFRTGEEAYADYLAFVGDRELIGIYKHIDNEGKSVRETDDGFLNTFWYGEGDGAYMDYELVKMAEKGDITVTFRAPQNESYNYSILKSKDGKEWEKIYSGKSDEGKTISFEDAMFIRVLSEGNEYMGISEVTLNAEKKKNN